MNHDKCIFLGAPDGQPCVDSVADSDVETLAGDRLWDKGVRGAHTLRCRNADGRPLEPTHMPLHTLGALPTRALYCSTSIHFLRVEGKRGVPSVVIQFVRVLRMRYTPDSQA